MQQQPELNLPPTEQTTVQTAPEATAAPEAETVPEVAMPDPDAPVWEGVTGPISFAQWEKCHRRKKPLYKWLWALLLYVAVQMALASIESGFYVGQNYIQSSWLLPFYLGMIALSVIFFIRSNRGMNKAEKRAYENYARVEQNGRLVRVFADRVEEVGVDTNTVRLCDADLVETKDLLYLSDGRVCIPVRSQDLTPEQGYALCCALYGKVKNHYGKEGFVGSRVQQYAFTPYGYVPQPLAPLPQPPQAEKPLFETRFAPTGQAMKAFASAQTLGLLRIWFPLALLPCYTIADALGTAYNRLYIFMGILLGVVALAAVLVILGLTCGERRSKEAKEPVTLRFYSDRLVAADGFGSSTCLQTQLQLHLQPQTLIISGPDGVYFLPLKNFEDVAALRAFLTPAAPIYEQASATAVPPAEDKEQE